MQQRTRPLRLDAAAVIAALIVSSGLAVAPTAGAAQQRSAGKSPSASVARRELLRLSDFPKGWKATTKTSSSNSGPTFSTSQLHQIAKCEGVSVSGLGNAASAQIEFSRAKAVQFVFEFLGVFSSRTSATATYGIFSSPKASSCLGPLLAKSIAAGTGKITASSVTTARLAFPKEGSATTAFRLGVPMKATTGQTVQLEADLIVIRSGRSLALLLPVSIVTGFPISLVHSLAKEAAARLK